MLHSMAKREKKNKQKKTVSRQHASVIRSHLMQHHFPGGFSSKEPICQCTRHQRCGFDPWVRKIPWRRAWLPTPVLSPGESHGQRSLAGRLQRVRHDWKTNSQLATNAILMEDTTTLSPTFFPGRRVSLENSSSFSVCVWREVYDPLPSPTIAGQLF